jgi:CBS domain containing-hemolysin-like protein
MAGNLAYPEAKQVLDLDEDSDEDTIGGHVISVLGKFPKRGDQVRLGAWLVTVLNVRRHRVLRLRFEPAPDESAETA